MKKKLNVAVLIGGPSAEREISLKTGAMVIRSLNPKRYNALPVTITKEGKWLLPEPERKFVRSPANQPLALQSGAALDRMKSQKVDVAFIAMHGTYGEDGTVQGLLEAVGIPYTGSGVLASALAMDKVKSAEIYAFHGLTIPRYVSFSRLDWKTKKTAILKSVKEMFAFPVMVKPRAQGSSVGVSIVRALKKLVPNIQAVFAHDRDVIVQEFIAGTEVTCAVLDEGNGRAAFALPPTEIVPKGSDFFDYRAKYAVGGSDEITPARLPQPLIKEIQALAVKAHTVLGCSGMSRTDMIVAGLTTNNLQLTTKGENPTIYVLETNTIPGMTEASLLPKAAKAAGISFPELLDRIIAAGLRRSGAM